MVVTLQRLVALEFLFLVELPELDGHVAGARGHVLPVRTEADVVDHARVLS